MKKAKIILTILGIFVLIIVSVGVEYHVEDKTTYEIAFPESENVTSVSIRNNDKQKEVTIIDKTDIEEILDVLESVKRITTTPSIQDFPVNAEDEIVVSFWTEHQELQDSMVSVFLYKKSGKYYMEEIYNGIYEILDSEYQFVEKFL